WTRGCPRSRSGPVSPGRTWRRAGRAPRPRSSASSATSNWWSRVSSTPRCGIPTSRSIPTASPPGSSWEWPESPSRSPERSLPPVSAVSARRAEESAAQQYNGFPKTVKGTVYHVPFTVAGRHRSPVDGLVFLHDGLRDAAAFTDLLALLLRPGTDLRTPLPAEYRPLLALGRTSPARNPAGGLDERSEFLTQPLGVGTAEVDLVGGAVKRERDCLLGLTPVKVINEKDLDFLCHESLLRKPESNWPRRPVLPLHPLSTELKPGREIHWSSTPENNRIV